jgi:hypothetical protein
MSPRKAPPVQVKAIKCTKCAAPIELRAPHQIATVACGSCGSVLDAKDPDLAILSQYERRTRVKPRIPLGTRGRLRGEIFQCIGFLTRTTTIEGSSYAWGEYLLWNPYKGFRWLTEYEGHWTSSKAAHVTPEPVSPTVIRLADGGTRTVAAEGTGYRLLASEYRHFQTCQAVVSYVVGEFYWQVKVGEKAMVSDYVHPPNILSMELAENEINWSIGDYVTGQDVWEAFKLAGDPPVASGVAPAQPSPYDDRVRDGTNWLITFLVVALGIHVAIAAISAEKVVASHSFVYSSHEPEKSKVTPSFELTGRTSNVVVKTTANVENHWIFNGYALINEETDVAYDFAREVSYYHGYDDGYWSEGSKVDEVTLPAIPSGRYFLRVEPQSDLERVEYTVSIHRDVHQLWPFVSAVLFLLVPPVILLFRRWSFEVERWKESDHPVFEPSGGSGDDDD